MLPLEAKFLLKSFNESFYPSSWVFSNQFKETCQNIFVLQNTNRWKLEVVILELVKHQ